MNETISLILVLIIVLFLDVGLEFLHVKQFARPIPSSVNNLYPKVLYQRYVKKERQSFFVSSMKNVGKVFLFSLGLLFGWFKVLYEDLEKFSSSSILVDTIFVGLSVFGLLVLYLLFDFLHMVFLKKTKLGKKNIGKFFKKHIKRYGLMFILGLTFVLVFILLYPILGQAIFVWLFVFIQGLVMGIGLVFTKWIVPLFHPLVPLEDGELREQIKVFLRQEGYQIDDVYVLKDGKANTLNAFVSGYFKSKRIVLFESLTKRLSNDEIIAVLAHELGHQKNKHIVFNLGLSFVFVFGFVAMLAWIMTGATFIRDMGYEQSFLGIRFLIYFMLFDGFVLVARFGLAYFSKRFEYQADQYAARVWYKESLVGSLRKIAKRNMEHLTPHPIYEMVYFSHPSLVNRLEKLYQEDTNES